MNKPTCTSEKLLSCILSHEEAMKPMGPPRDAALLIQGLYVAYGLVRIAEAIEKNSGASTLGDILCR
jgi:hypothetical protein